MKIDRRCFMQASAMLATSSTIGMLASKPAQAQTISAAMTTKQNALLQAAVQSGDVPGVVAAVATGDKILYEGAFGERVLGQGTAMSMDTVMWLASMTKPIVGAAAMQLVEQGKLSLDEPASKVLPALGEVKVLTGWDSDGKPILRAPKSPITLRHLLTHTAGFTYDIWNPETARFHKTFNVPRAGSGKKAGLAIPLSFDPGTQWEYGINLDWTGQVIEAASGMKLGQYIQKNITEPLGMMSTAFKISPDMRARMAKVHQRDPDGVRLTVTQNEVPQEPEFEPGGGGMYSTASDYIKFMQMILNKGSGNGHQILKPDTVALMSKNAMGLLRVKMLPSQNKVVSQDAEFFPGVPKTWGLSFMINEEQAPTGRSAGSLAWAGLANTFFWIDPTKNIAGLLMVQVLPFVDPKALALFSQFEKNTYST
jgi:CubicO group peptidase (beta-lactamase class C family)